MTTSVTSVNPADGKAIASYTVLEASGFDKVLQSSSEGFERWKRLSVRERADFILRIAAVIESGLHRYAAIATAEMGKPISQSVAELEKSAVSLRYYAAHAEAFLQPEMIPTSNRKSYVAYRPLGTVLAVMPWNFPYWQVFRVMGPVLLAGNAMLLKHASNVSGCALAIESILKDAGLPEGVFRALIIRAEDTEYFIAHPAVQAVTFTGSTATGKKIAATAGRYIKKQVLELGGSDAYIVCEDADLRLAARALAQSRMNNAGQSCIAAKRFIVHKAVEEEFIALLSEEMRQYEMGDPAAPSCKLGPMAREDLRNDLHRQVEESVALGARMVMGGYIPDREGAYYPPTILAGVAKGMPAYSEECFGPVAIVITVASEEEAVRVANDTAFGLGGGIFSRDEERAFRIAELLVDAGTVNVNSCVVSEPALPFGGIKESGYGRELSRNGLIEFVNVKTIVAK